MVKKTQKLGIHQKSAPYSSNTVKDSAQQIWLAGLGAFAKAQEEGTKVFDTLVKQGMAIQRKTQAVAEDKMTDATSRISGMATDIQSKASNRWDSLENIFEERVAKALGKLGVPLAQDVTALAERVDRFDHEIRELKASIALASKGARLDTARMDKSRAKTTGKTVGQQKSVLPAIKKATRPVGKRVLIQSAGLPAGSRSLKDEAE